MAKLIRRMSSESRSYQILSELYKKGDIKPLSSKESYAIDNSVEIEFKKINEEYSAKERSSMISIAQLESSSVLV